MFMILDIIFLYTLLGTNNICQNSSWLIWKKRTLTFGQVPQISFFLGKSPEKKVHMHPIDYSPPFQFIVYV